MLQSNQGNTVLNPQDMNAAFAAAFNSGQIENLLALYEPDAVLIDHNSNEMRGTEAIRQALEQLLQIKGTMISTNIYCILYGDLALLRAHFVIHGTGPDGRSSQFDGHTSEIVRKQPNGGWLYIVDHPFGADPLKNDQ
ncbi:YybH family protein [Brevibacillus sp. SIMBA_040]|uniref:YybH family protein n=1 Tax=unclassified Brevibacillus TaxID=2684853 RepID=UPI00397C6A99